MVQQTTNNNNYSAYKLNNDILNDLFSSFLSLSLSLSIYFSLFIYFIYYTLNYDFFVCFVLFCLSHILSHNQKKIKRIFTRKNKTRKMFVFLVSILQFAIDVSFKKTNSLSIFDIYNDDCL